VSISDYTILALGIISGILTGPLILPSVGVRPFENIETAVELKTLRVGCGISERAEWLPRNVEN